MTTLKQWMVGTALPFWSEAGFDRVGERFRERLDWSGRPLDVPHRAMLQARQIFAFSHAARLGWFAEGGDLAEMAMRSLLRDFCVRSGSTASFVFSIEQNGAVSSTIRDAYAHAFVLFATAHLYRLNGDRRLLDLADQVIAYMDQHLLDREHAGLFDQFPVADRAKRQNPLMHLLEAHLALDEAAPGRGHLERAGELVGLFQRRLFQDGQQVLLEHFAQDWSSHPDPVMRDIVEPGHHFEWVWLLRQYESRSGADLRAWTGPLFDVARRQGLSSSGLLYDEIAGDGRVLKRSNRLWPHTEALKAATTRHDDGDPDAQSFAQVMVDALMVTFLDRPFAGGWIDHVSEQGEPLVTSVPASSLYHLLLAATESAPLFDDA